MAVIHFHPYDPTASQGCWDTTLASSKAWLQNQPKPAWPPKVGMPCAGTAHSSHVETRQMFPSWHFFLQKRTWKGSDGWSHGAPMSVCGNWESVCALGTPGILLLLSFLRTIKDDGFSNSKSSSHGIGQENEPGNRINLPKFGIYAT